MQNKKIEFIDINLIKINKNQIRQSFDENQIISLANSIKENGLLQPILIKKIENFKPYKYEIIAGERRFRASKYLNLKKIECIVLNENEEKNYIISIIENLQREALNPIEEAKAYKKLTRNKTHEQISKIVGKSRSYITNMLLLLNLDDYVQKLIITKKISAGHAKNLYSLKRDLQIDIANKIINEKMTVRELENYLKKLRNQNLNNNFQNKNLTNIIKIENDYHYQETEKSKNKINIENPIKNNQHKNKKYIKTKKTKNLEKINENILIETQYLQEKLMNFFNTDVKVNLNNNFKGSINIKLYDNDDYERILSLFED